MLKRSMLFTGIIFAGQIICLILILMQIETLRTFLVILEIALVLIGLVGLLNSLSSIGTIHDLRIKTLKIDEIFEPLTTGYQSERWFYAKFLASYYYQFPYELYEITRKYANHVQYDQHDSVLKILQENNRTEENRKLALDIYKTGEDHSVNSPQKIVDKAEDMVILFGEGFVVSTFGPAILSKILTSGFYPEFETKQGTLNLIESISKCKFKFTNTSQFLTKELYNFLLKKENPVEESVSS